MGFLSADNDRIVAGPSALSRRELERCRRQLLLPGFTREHQEKLKAATVLVAGIGGLGGTAALYLAVAGVGRLVLAHAGNLTLSNMNRQILMRHNRIGADRVSQGAATIRDVNPDVAVEIHNERIDGANAGRLLSRASLALSARPNFSERSALNRACLASKVPLVEAAMNGMEGYLFNVIPGASACLSCVYPEENPEWEELGFPVLGAVSGMLGCMMAIEAIKLLTGYGKPLASEMLHFSTHDMEFRKVRIERIDDCPICGSRSDSAAQVA